MKELLDKIALSYRKQGAGKTCQWLLGRVLERIFMIRYRVSYVVERPLDNKIPDIKTKVPITITECGEEDIQKFEHMREPWNHYRRIIKDRFRRGQTCIMSHYNGRPVGYLWFTDLPEKDKSLGLIMRPQSDESYGFDLYVVPEHRKDSVGFALISQWLTRVRDLGKRKAIGVVASYNDPMLMMTKLVFGFKKTKEFHSLELFKRRGYVVSKKILS